MRPTYSFVIPVHDEEDSLPLLYPRLRQLMGRLDGPSEVLFVDDGSRDGSRAVLAQLCAQDARCKVIELARNFGHQKAVSAGLDMAVGRATIVMDADLQDPPEVVEEMAHRWREGYEIVYGVRTDRASDSWFKRTSAHAFYRFIGMCSSVDIPPEVGDFRLIDRRALDAFKEMPEKNRYVRGMFAWLGFRQVGVPYARPEREEGATSYTLPKMLRLAEDGVVGFSQVPLDGIVVGGATLTAAGAAGALALGGARLAGVDVSGRATSVTASVVLAGLQLSALGVVGRYVGRIFDEAVDRPLYVVRSTQGFDLRPLPASPDGALVDLTTGRVQMAGRAG